MNEIKMNNMKDEKNKYYGEERFNLNRTFQLNNKSDLEASEKHKKTDPYLFNICDYKNNFKGIHDLYEGIEGISVITDKFIIKNIKCNYSILSNGEKKAISNWIDFFYYLNETIIDSSSNGKYSCFINIPKQWVFENEIIKMIIRHLIFKGFKCKVFFNYKECDEFNQMNDCNKKYKKYYILNIIWDNIPDDVFEFDIYKERLENKN